MTLAQRARIADLNSRNPSVAQLDRLARADNPGAEHWHRRYDAWNCDMWIGALREWDRKAELERFRAAQGSAAA